MVERGGVRVAIEATTTNPPRNGGGAPRVVEREAFPHIPTSVELSRDELVFQVAKALRRKTVDRIADGTAYWDIEHVRGLPFVIAIEAFHGETSLFHSDSAIASYLYGMSWSGNRLADGSIEFTASFVTEHSFAGKTIPSGFFGLPEASNVSAVIFSNAATVSQFERIGVEHGLEHEGMTVLRRGTCLDPDPTALVPRKFGYVVEAGKHRETFATGMSVLHNPHSIAPLPQGFFSDTVEMRLNGAGFVETVAPEFAPFGSVTEIYTHRSADPASTTPQ